MSRHVVGYEGEGRSRRPVYADEGPASSAVRDPVAALGVLSATQVRGTLAPVGGAGKVEISRVEVDEATRAEAKAARTNPTPGFHAMRPAADHMQASRMNGAARHVEVMAARKSPPEEKTVTESLPEERTNIPEIIPSEPLTADVGFDRLAMAAESARTAWDAKAAADTAWDIAREALAVAYAGVESLFEPLPTPPDDEHVHQILMVPVTPRSDVTPEPIGGGPEARRFPTKPLLEELPLTPRQEQILAATVRLDGDRKAVAREFGLKAYQSVDIVLEVAGKKGRLPIELIPKLPARFAKYSGI